MYLLASVPVLSCKCMHALCIPWPSLPRFPYLPYLPYLASTI